MPDFKNPAVFALLSGVVLGAVLGLWTARRLAHRIGLTTGSPKLVSAAAWAVTMLGALPSFLMGYIVGGNLGLLANAATVNSRAGELVATGLGIALLFAAGLAACAAIGAWTGAALAPTRRQPMRAARIVSAGPGGGAAARERTGGEVASV